VPHHRPYHSLFPTASYTGVFHILTSSVISIGSVDLERIKYMLPLPFISRYSIAGWLSYFCEYIHIFPIPGDADLPTVAFAPHSFVNVTGRRSEGIRSPLPPRISSGGCAQRLAFFADRSTLFLAADAPCNAITLPTVSIPCATCC